MSEDKYVNINIDFSKFSKGKFDVRVPVYLTLKEILQIIEEALQVKLDLVNPAARVLQTGKVIQSLTTLQEAGEAKNGLTLFVEER